MAPTFPFVGPWKGVSVDLRPRQKYIDLAKKFDNIFDLVKNSSKYFDLANNTRLHFLAKLSLNFTFTLNALKAVLKNVFKQIIFLQQALHLDAVSF